MVLVMKHEELWHVQDNAPIGKRNPNFLEPQGPALEEWDTDDDADVDDTQYEDNDAASMDNYYQLQYCATNNSCNA